MKDFFKALFSKWMLLNIVLGIGVFFGAMYWGLKRLDQYTFHGEAIEVPALKGVTLDEAETTCRLLGLGIEVIDSTYAEKQTPGAIIEQNPEAGSTVKHGRKIYVKINTKLKRKVEMPEVRDMSLRQAQNRIVGAGLKLDSVQYVQGENDDLVRDALIGGRSVGAGEKIAVGTGVVLQVEKNATGEEIKTASVRGLNREEAEQKLLGNGLMVGAVIYDVTPKNATEARQYKVYRQRPITNAKTVRGSGVDIWLSADPAKLDAPEEIAPEEDTEAEDESTSWF